MRSMLDRGSTLWILQALSGALLVVMVALHWLAQHLVVEGGLRDYSEVVSYLRQPLVLVLEIAFLIVVSAHALLGVRAVLIDLGPGKMAERLINCSLGVVGVGMVAYGIDLVLAIVR